MVIVAIKALELTECLVKTLDQVGVGVGISTFLPIPTPPKIPSDSRLHSPGFHSIYKPSYSGNRLNCAAYTTKCKPYSITVQKLITRLSRCRSGQVFSAEHF